MTYALKFTNAEGVTSAQGFAWPLPRGSRPGKWVKAEGELEVCVNGIHAVGFDGATEWLNARCFVIELGGDVIYDENERKYVARRGRLVREVTSWDERAQRLFAADCAAHVLPIFEKAYPNDKRPREAINAARAYARNPSEANRDRRAAAWNAAWNAAGAATGAAAGAAAWAAARDATGAAARAAARDAAWDATGAAAWDATWAERAWQATRLRRLYIDAPEVSA